jgi:putative SOS response-associated peptidase YedK
MCGRFSLSVTPEALVEQFSLHLSGAVPPPPRYNIAPTQPVVAVRTRNAAGERELVLLHWGLIPSWAKDPSIGNRMINARAETLAGKPSFRTALRRRRCLVPADGFYEWARGAAGKQPYHIRRVDRAPFAFAGLWEHWVGADGSEILSCTLVTTGANALMRPLHHRMPVILAPEDYPRWLHPEEGRPEGLLPLLAPRKWEGMETVAVSAYVNNPRNEGAQCIAPLPPGGTEN